MLLAALALAQPRLAAAQTSRAAATIGQSADASISVTGSGASEYGESAIFRAAITVLEIARGAQALALLPGAGPVAPPPEGDLEYLLVRIRIAGVAGATSRIPYVAAAEHFTVYDARDSAYPLPRIHAPEPTLLGKSVYPNETREGWVPFLVARDHPRPYLFFVGGLWFQLFE
ncbi:MAG: hypothetical protein IT494_03095 [Gammaproteobacteria bacterium]|nr:hypothetical protein [Gammaproteobacteria bacterium]